MLKQAKILDVPVGKLVAYEWKIDEVISEINKGELSFSKNTPSLISYVPDMKKYLILDGHHRIIEQFKEGATKIKAIISEHVPKTYNLSSDVAAISKIDKKIIEIGKKKEITKNPLGTILGR